MAFLGQTEIQYARCLWGPRTKVLSVLRDEGSNPLMRFDSDDPNGQLICTIFNDIRVENLYSNPNSGAKRRIDIHIAPEHIQGVLEILEPFVNSLEVEFDEASRGVPDPTGSEHPDGLPLGDTYPETKIKAISIANFSTDGYSVQSTESELIIDRERYISKGKRLHFGVQSVSECALIDRNNSFLLIIKYDQLIRLIHGIKLVQQALSN